MGDAPRHRAESGGGEATTEVQWRSPLDEWLYPQCDHISKLPAENTVKRPVNTIYVNANANWSFSVRHFLSLIASKIGCILLLVSPSLRADTVSYV